MDELEMEQTGTQLIEQSNVFIVSTEQDYKNAVEICKDIKFRIKQVEDYWKDLKDKAYKSWKDICSKEKQLLEPYTNAEADIKRKMTTWQREKMEQEKLIREEQERYRKSEEERLLGLARKAELDGKIEHSEYLVDLAEQTKVIQFEQPKQTKVVGSAVKATWKARITNTDLVPINFAGAEIRPISQTVLDKLAKASSGKMKIPGVEFYEDINISVSRG